MPNATIEVRRRYTRAEEAGIVDAVHAAMMEGLKIPEGTRPFDSSSTSRTAFHTIASDTPSSTSTCSPAVRSGPRRPCTRQSSGTWSRSAFPPNQVKILLRESPAENWGIRGGVPASEVDLGFEVAV